MVEELKSCPFCGEVPVILAAPETGWEVRCANLHGCNVQPNSQAPIKRLAVQLWNTRSPAWRDIESAPRDGVGAPILLWNGHWRGVGWYEADMREGERWVAEDGAIVGPQPTHWMPLPLPPEEKA